LSKLVQRISLLTLAGLTWIILGCDRSQVAAPTTQASATQASSATRPAVATPRAAAEPASILIDDKPYDFPPVTLVLGPGENDQMQATIFTDDPPEAAEKDYAGNSLYLEMNPEIPADNTLAGAQWDFQATNAEQVDEVNGVFLQGRRYWLQPNQVHVEFHNSESPVKISLSGTFVMFDQEAADSAGTNVAVRAELTTLVKVDSSPGK
jgi:hypothetical protein